MPRPLGEPADPVPDETLPSLLDRVAAAHHVTRVDLAVRIGLCRRGSTRTLSGWTHRLPARAAARTGRALGVDVSAHLAGDRLTRPGGWAWTSASAICPECVAEIPARTIPRRSAWSFACTRHERLLVTRCPTCDTAVDGEGGRGDEPFRISEIPRPDRCGGRAAGHRCGRPLGSLPAAPIPPEIVLAQRRVDDLVSDQDGPDRLLEVVLAVYDHPAPPVHGLPADLLRRFHARRGYHRPAPPGGHRRPRPPDDPAGQAVAITTALRVHDAGVDATAELFATAARHRRVPLNRAARTYRLNAATTGRIRRSRDDGALLPPDVTAHLRIDARSVPTRIAAVVVEELFADLCTTRSAAAVGTFLSLCLARIALSSDWQTAGRYLGIDGRRAASVAKQIRKTMTGEAFADRLALLTIRLDRTTDHTHRRRLSHLVPILPMHLWLDVCERTGQRRGRGQALGNRRAASAILAAAITGTDPLNSPTADEHRTATPSGTDAIRHAIRSMHHDAVADLHRLADELTGTAPSRESDGGPPVSRIPASPSVEDHTRHFADLLPHPRSHGEHRFIAVAAVQALTGADTVQAQTVLGTTGLTDTIRGYRQHTRSRPDRHRVDAAIADWTSRLLRQPVDQVARRDAHANQLDLTPPMWELVQQRSATRLRNDQHRILASRTARARASGTHPDDLIGDATIDDWNARAHRTVHEGRLSTVTAPLYATSTPAAIPVDGLPRVLAWRRITSREQNGQPS